MGRVQGPAPRLIVFARNADGDIVRGSQSSFQKDRAQEHPPWGGCGFDERRRGSSIAFSLCSGRAPDTFSPTSTAIRGPPKVFLPDLD